MQTSIILFFVSVVFVIGYICAKYLLNKKQIDQMQNDINTNTDFVLAANLPNSLEESKNLTFAFVDDVRIIISRNATLFLHWVLHFFVIILGFISDITDVLYAKARDFFLRTATKEQEVVTKFWHHLKEYKREKEEER
jgi:hypothetical protein